MNRLTTLALGLAFAGSLAVGCSKTADVATPNIDTNKIQADATKCTDLATSYATVTAEFATAATGTVDTAKLESTLDDLKGKVPDNVKTDFDTIANGIKNAKGATGVSEFLSSPEYTKADKEITNYLTVECSKVGS